MACNQHILFFVPQQNKINGVCNAEMAVQRKYAEQEKQYEEMAQTRQRWDGCA